jgi:hypothetical protein
MVCRQRGLLAYRADQCFAKALGLRVEEAGPSLFDYGMLTHHRHYRWLFQPSASKITPGRNAVDLLLIIIISAIVSAILCAIVAGAKKHSIPLWFIAGLFFPVVAPVVIIFFRQAPPGPSTHAKCPDCKEFIRKDAIVCKHCGCKVTPQVVAVSKAKDVKVQKMVECSKCMATNESANASCWKCGLKFTT